MRRFLPLLLISFLVVVAAVAGTFLAGQASRQNPESIRSIAVYTTLPVEQVAALAQEYEKTAGVRVNVFPLTAGDLIARLKVEAAAPRADLVLAGAGTLDAVRQAGLLAPFSSAETDIIPERYSGPDDLWTGLWYDPVVFAANRDFLKKTAKPPATWADLPGGPDVRLVMTDFMAADEAATLLYAMAAAQGEEPALAYLGKLHSHIVQYAKFLATPSRMTGLGEADIAITLRSEAMHYIKDGFPLDMIIPSDGTAINITGAGLAAGAPRAEDAGRFLDWLIGDAAQGVLENSGVYLLPTNPESRLNRGHNGKELAVFAAKAPLTPVQKAKLLDKWVQTVRLSPR